jgi:hypothetical protein
MPQITSRKELQERIERAVADLAALLGRSPGFTPYEDVERQLRLLERWTAGGREPTDDEREQIRIGLIVVREFDPQPEMWLYDIMQNLHAIQGYVRVWPPDGEPPYK